jgi:hypothetical protein
MSTRITDTMRQAITTRLINHRFEKDEKALRRREHELAMKVHRARYDTPTRNAMEALPEGWLPVDHRVRLRIGSYSHELRFIDPARVAFADKDYSVEVAKLKRGDELAAACQEYRVAANALAAARKELTEKTSRTLAGFGSVNRLVSAWPEIKPFLDQLGYSDEKKSLPAVIPAELNQSLGL